jgi:hypothetical protein
MPARRPAWPSAAVSLYNKLLEGFADGTIITTNWDTVADRILWGIDSSPRSPWQPQKRWVYYTPVAQVVVDFRGDPVKLPSRSAFRRRLF